MLKIICVKKFHGVKFSRFRSIREFFLTVDGYDVDERLESFWCLYSSTTKYRESQVLLAVYSCRFDIYLGGGGGGDLCAHLSIDHRRISFFRVF